MLIEIPIEKLKPNSWRKPGGTAGLAKDIKRHGQSEPIEVIPDGNTGFYFIRNGHRRVEALKAIGCKTVLAEVVQ
jgi:ParB-like chromosome segregation protein Spo0J